MTKLNLGTTISGKRFTLPDDAITQTLAILAIKGAGKTSTAVVIAEETARARISTASKLAPCGCSPASVRRTRRSGRDRRSAR